MLNVPKRSWCAADKDHGQNVLDATGDPNRWPKFEALMLRFAVDDELSPQEFGVEFLRLLEATDVFLFEQKMISKRED